LLDPALLLVNGGQLTKRDFIQNIDSHDETALSPFMVNSVDQHRHRLL
jgi:hypothetical protein